MTFVGKIFVILIMAFALLFLGISTVVFTTHTDWKKATEEQKKKVSELSNTNTTLQADLDAANEALAKAKTEHAAQLAQNEKNIAALNEDIKRANEQITDLRSKVDVAQQNSLTALTDAEERRKETDRLREQKSAVEKQANEFKLQETELRDRIRELERLNATMDANNKDLRDRVARFSQLLRSNGLSDDITTVKGLASPPPVQGQVGRVDAQNRRVEITIGSDDGLVPGHELYLMRLSPRPEYLGKIRVQSVDPDQAVGSVIGNTVQGKKIQEGDIVSSTIRPRL
ncbi:MAG: coiled-coil domain-containing protein [Isosphaeraceae bacterium]